ncbi:hypothetical protein EH171_10640 [Enterovibrio baiacu]|nr:hypothetical protein [Enterovibrio baiacu]
MAKPFSRGIRRAIATPIESDVWHWQSAMHPGLHQRSNQHLTDRRRATLDVNECDLQGVLQRPCLLFTYTLELILYAFSILRCFTRVLDHVVTLAPVFANARPPQPQYDHHQNMKKAMAMHTQHQAAIAPYVKSLAC